MAAKIFAFFATTFLFASCAHTLAPVETHAFEATEQAEISVEKLASDLGLTLTAHESEFGRYFLDDGKGHSFQLDRRYPKIYQLNFRSRAIEYPHLQWKDDVLYMPIGAYNSICIDLGRQDKMIERGIKIHRPNRDKVSYYPEGVAAKKTKQIVIGEAKPAKTTTTEKTSTKAEKALPLKGLTIVVDAGHGGKDPGGIGVDGIREKDIVLEVSLAVEKLLKAQGATVKMTRTTDVFLELKERSGFANKAKADLFVSIHANIASRDSAKGIETWFKAGGTRGNTSQTLSKQLNDAMVAVSGAVDRGARADQRGLHVLRATKMPAALVELGFMSNASEAKNLANKTYLSKLAKGIADGIVKYHRS